MESPANRAAYWPGGIPAYIRCHPEPIEDGMMEEVKGWQLFIEENAKAHDPDNPEKDFEVNQRRRLVDQWASMSQEARDSFQSRAPVRSERDRDGWYPEQLRSRDWIRRGFCHLVVEQPLSPRNRALWTKICILMYHLADEDKIHNFGTSSQVVTMNPNPADTGPVKPEDHCRHCFVEPADFSYMAMTSHGTVVFHAGDRATFFADQETLDTGRLLLCDLDSNGAIRVQSRVWPLWTYMIYCYVYGLGWYGDRVIEDYWYADVDCDANAALDMERPILDLLEAKFQYFEHPDRVGIDYWRKAIERYAPGYLEMEANGGGMVPDYDHSKLLE